PERPGAVLAVHLRARRPMRQLDGRLRTGLYPERTGPAAPQFSRRTPPRSRLNEILDPLPRVVCCRERRRIRATAASAAAATAAGSADPAAGSAGPAAGAAARPAARPADAGRPGRPRAARGPVGR